MSKTCVFCLRDESQIKIKTYWGGTDKELFKHADACIECKGKTMRELFKISQEAKGK